MDLHPTAFQSNKYLPQLVPEPLDSDVTSLRITNIRCILVNPPTSTIVANETFSKYCRYHRWHVQDCLFPVR